MMQRKDQVLERFGRLKGHWFRKFFVIVIPTKVGTPKKWYQRILGIPASAGMTVETPVVGGGLFGQAR